MSSAKVAAILFRGDELIDSVTSVLVILYAVYSGGSLDSAMWSLKVNIYIRNTWFHSFDQVHIVNKYFLSSSDESFRGFSLLLTEWLIHHYHTQSFMQVSFFIHIFF